MDVSPNLCSSLNLLKNKIPHKAFCIFFSSSLPYNPISPYKLLTSPWTCRQLEVVVVMVAGLLPALKHSSQPCCLWLPLSEGHIMALRRPSFLDNDCFLCSCPGWLVVWVASWPPDKLTSAHFTSAVLLLNYTSWTEWGFDEGLS